MSNFKVVIVRSDRTSTIRTSLSKTEAEELAQKWRDETFNADNYYEPVPKVVVIVDRDGE